VFTFTPYDMNCKSWKSILCNISVANNSPAIPTNNMNGNRMTLLINLLTHRGWGHLNCLNACSRGFLTILTL
jgi:hypothetical protein